MTLPVLSTKLYRPPQRPGLVHRSRLTDRLNAGLHRKLTLVSAPPGFGKTTLISAWVADCQRPVAWLSLDQKDKDPARFLIHLIAALQTISPQLGMGALGLLQTPQPPPLEFVLTVLLNQISSSKSACVLVCDDYHLLDSQAVDQILVFMLEHLPVQLHLVVATREDPPFHLARLRARDQLTELRIADLRFSAAEAAEFLNQSMGLTLSGEQLVALEARTEGWIAGLQLAAVSLQGHEDVGRFIASFSGSHRFIMDYLMEEVLNRQSESVRQFLLQTSILNRISAALCEAVLEAPEAGQILDYLDQANLLVVRLDEQRLWYRYHHLFAEMLQARLSRDLPARIPLLHQRASRWYEQQGNALDAIHHAQAAQDFERAAHLLERAWPEMDASFQTGIWLGWIEQMPESVIQSRPVLMACHGWALLNDGQLEAGAARLQAAESALSQPDQIVSDVDQLRALPATIATARAFHAQATGNAEATLNFARQALDHLPEQETIRRGVVTAIIGLAHWTRGDLDSAYRALSDSMDGFRLAGQINFSLSGTYGLADIRIAQGRLNEAIDVYQQALKLARAQGEPVPQGMADLYLGLGALFLEQGDGAAATDYLTRSAALGEIAGLPDWRYRWCLAQARLHESRSENETARALLDQAEAVYFRTPVPDLRPVAALKARLALRQGQLSLAKAWARTLDPAAEDSFLNTFDLLTLARLYLADHAQPGKESELNTLLARLQRLAQAGGWNGSLIEIKLLQALALQQQSQPGPALETLEQALQQAEPEGYVQLFLDEGQALAGLLKQAAAQHRMPDYASRILAVWDARRSTDRVAEPAPGPHATRTLQQDLIEPLSPRELEILALIAQGLSNEELAERLFLALSTVKGHNQNIFGKLGVKRRTEAVARARELGLLAGT